MPFLLLALVSVAIAWLRGVSPLQLARIQLRWLALPAIAFLIQFLAFVRFGDATVDYAVWLQLASLGLLLIFLAANLRYRSFLLAIVGTALNLAVITANGGYMPAPIAAVERIGYPEVAARLTSHGYFQKSKPLDEQTRLPWLADVIYLPFFGAGRLVSIGDLFVGAGVFLFIQEALVGRRPRLTPAPAP
jgi:hypothetical protein